jgi:hypothetical protein
MSNYLWLPYNVGTHNHFLDLRYSLGPWGENVDPWRKHKYAEWNVSFNLLTRLEPTVTVLPDVSFSRHTELSNAKPAILQNSSDTPSPVRDDTAQNSAPIFSASRTAWPSTSKNAVLV